MKEKEYQNKLVDFFEELGFFVENREGFINYDDDNFSFPEDAQYITIKDLPLEIVEEIKEATFEEVQKILCNYI